MSSAIAMVNPCMFQHGMCYGHVQSPLGDVVQDCELCCIINTINPLFRTGWIFSAMSEVCRSPTIEQLSKTMEGLHTDKSLW